MIGGLPAEFVWFSTKKGIELGIHCQRLSSEIQTRGFVNSGGLKLPLVGGQRKFLYRTPTTITRRKDGLDAGPVFAILAGEAVDSFQGARLNFRDLMESARGRRIFIYALSVADVPDDNEWFGYVRLGHMRWLRVPVPRPEAVYNRIPTRALERTPRALVGRKRLSSKKIKVFNPEYFSKSNIYRVLNNAKLGHYLPATVDGLVLNDFTDMLGKYGGVYLKPSGGSVGHGMFRVKPHPVEGWSVAVVKDTKTRFLRAKTIEAAWKYIQMERVPGQYVMQEAISGLRWRNRPCDVRALVQKRHGKWRLIGRGVRVSGAYSITSHVPTGGFIASADEVLGENFGSDASEVDEKLSAMTESCARAIDEYYGHELAEMSMDIGIDATGRPWFFEANAKPMKFDEEDIRSASIEGVIEYFLTVSGRR